MAGVPLIHPGYLDTGDLLREYRLILSSAQPLPGPDNSRQAGSVKAGERDIGLCFARRLALLRAESAFRGLDLEGRDLRATAIASRLPSGSAHSRASDPRWGATAISADARIPLPNNAQQLWSQHKYSVMARDFGQYREIGQLVSRRISSEAYFVLQDRLQNLLLAAPGAGGLHNALQHMWGYVSGRGWPKAADPAWSDRELCRRIQARVAATAEPYLMQSIALTELQAWLPET